MVDAPILYTKRGHIAHITLNKSDSGNQIDDRAAFDLRDACAKVMEDTEIYVTLITSNGPAFCIGSAAFPDGTDTLETLAMRRVANAIAAIPKPIVAAIEGAATGQGLELALACDLRVGATSAYFRLDQLEQGWLPWDGGTQRLPRSVPRALALDMLLTGRTVGGEEAQEAGLLCELVANGQATQRAEALAEKLAAMAPLANIYAKEAVVKGMDMTLDQGIRLEADLAILLHTSADRNEGIRAFLEKRDPSFTGR